MKPSRIALSVLLTVVIAVFANRQVSSQSDEIEMEPEWVTALPDWVDPV